MLKKIFDNLEEYFLVGTLGISVIIVFIQVIMRYLFHNSLSWSEEVARYLFLWLSWIGASYAVRERAHFRVEIFANLMKGRVRQYYDILIFIAWFIFCIFLTWQSYNLTHFLWIHHQLSAALQMPMAFAYASVPVGSALMAFRVLLEISKMINGLRKG